MNKTKLLPRTPLFLVVLATIVLLRLFTLPTPDLIDSTEGRYASVAKLMLDRDDWVTPWINFKGDVKPYLGKPPLHFWLMDTAYLLLGQNNFAARIPGVVSAVGIGTSIWLLCASLLSTEAAFIAAIVLASSCGFFFLSGAVVLDVTLTLGITIACASFLLADRSRRAGYLFFAGLGLGVLVKGPLACVLAGFTIAPWALIQKIQTKQWPEQLKKLPWITGFLLFVAIVAPWYIWAELRNPGFLEYFLWNENFGRYMKSDYGDEYGTGHRQIFGTGWAFMVPALFPWSLIVLGLLICARKTTSLPTLIRGISSDSLLLYSLTWTVSCPVLLMAAKQYTATYITSSLPGFAVLTAVLWTRQSERQWLREQTISNALRATTALLGLVLLIGAVVSFRYGSGAVASSAAVALGVLTLISVRSAGRFVDVASSVARLGSLTCVVFTFVVLCYGNHISLQRSTRKALQQARNLVPTGAPLKVGFPFYFPFSATFYGPLMQGGAISVSPVADTDIQNPNVDLLIVRQRNLDRLQAIAPGKELLGEVGQWKIFKAK